MAGRWEDSVSVRPSTLPTQLGRTETEQSRYLFEILQLSQDYVLVLVYDQDVLEGAILF